MVIYHSDADDLSMSYVVYLIVLYLILIQDIYILLMPYDVFALNTAVV